MYFPECVLHVFYMNGYSEKTGKIHWKAPAMRSLLTKGENID